MIKRTVRWILRTLGIIPKPRFIVRHLVSHPKIHEIAEHEIVIVGDARLQKWACFKCPGGCGAKIMLSLSKSRRPCWKITQDWIDRPTISPSVWQQNECKCHFWIRDGGVKWCRDQIDASTS